jgi:NAD(P)-dependent dehydrogenase (short-subunit alcohol dehydrogenase family)
MSLEINLKGKVAIITGMSRGIGLGIAHMMLEAGCIISGCDLEEGSNPYYNKLIEKGTVLDRPIFFNTTDVTKPEELQLLVDRTIKKFGIIDVLISNAGTNYFEGLENCSRERWQKNLDLNLNSHWYLSKFCKPYLEKSDVGSIVVIASNHAFSTIPGASPYNIAKTALKGLVQSIAIEWGPSIRANAIAPGYIETHLTEKWLASFSNPKAEETRTKNLHPVKRLGTPQEVGAFCAFLCSEYAGFMTGATYLMDGGRSALMQDH